MKLVENISGWLNRRSKTSLIVGGLTSVFLVGLVDFLAPAEMSFTPFYLIPILVATWFVGKRAGVFITVAATLTASTIDLMQSITREPLYITCWNATSRLGVFLVVVLLLDTIKTMVEGLRASIEKKTAELIAKIAEHQRLEILERETELRFRQVTESIREVFWMTNAPKNQMLYISPGYEEIWGRTCESLCAAPHDWMNAIHHDDRDRIRQALLKQVTGEYDEEYRIVRPDGSIRWIHDRAFPIRNDDGKVYRLAGIAEDITKRKQAESRLSTLAHAVEGTSELICITDLQDRFIFVNQAFQRVHGYTEAEILGKTPEILHSPRNSSTLLSDLLEQTHLGGWRGEVLDRRKDGSEFPVYLNTSLVKDGSGQVIGLMGVAQDITQRKQFVEDLQRQQAEMKVLFDLIPAMIWFKDANNRILRLNKRAAEMAGKSVAEIEGKPTTIVHPREAAKFYADDLEVIRSGLPKLGIVETVRNPEGKDLWVQTDKVPYCDKAGNVIGIVVIAHDITDRKRAEESLRLLGSAVEQSKESIVITDAGLDMPGPRIVFINPAFTKMTGYTAEEILGKTPRILQGPHSDRAVLRRLRKTLARGEPFLGEIINYRKDGAEYYLELQVTPIRGASGAIAHFVAIQRDVTERKRAEAEMTTLAHAVESTSELICITDLQDRLTFVNQAFLRAYGYEEHEILGKTPGILFSPKNPAKLVDEILKQTRSGGWRGEVLDRRKDGTEFPISLSTSRVSDELGNVVGLMGVARDISERKEAQEALRQSEERFRKAFGAAPVAMVIAGVDGHFLQVNQAFCEMLGYTEKELLAKTSRDITYPDDLDATYAYIDRLLRRERDSSPIEKRYLHKCGHVVWGRATASLIVRDEDRRPVHFIVHIQDVTDRRRLEREILEVCDREQGRIGQDLHDGLCQQLVSTAFASVRLSQVLATKAPSEAGTAKEIAGWLDAAISQARALARGLYPVKLEADGLASALQELAEYVNNRFGITCVLENPEAVSLTDNAVATHLYRIAQEAVTNAVKHSKADRIVIKLTGDGDNFSVGVRDNGVGIPDHITNGMGLHIMQYRTRMIGGHLKIERGSSGGTVVVCSFQREAPGLKGTDRV